MEIEETDVWHFLPDTLWLHVFSYLEAGELASARQVCVHWSRLGLDELLWKRLLYVDFHIDPSIDKPAGSSWSGEYRRLREDVPLVLTEVLESHSNQVLHVSFSHDASMFATASKDGTIMVWDATIYPCRSKYSQDMTHYSWKYPHFSQFNSADTLLLVSGIHFGSLHNTSGEIAVFTLQYEFMLQCRVANKPVDTFGCWLGDNHLVSSDLHWLAHHTSLSTVWINRASQEPESEHIPVINQLYRLYNTNASTVRYEYHLVSSDLHWLAHHTSLSTVWINRASQEPESEHIPVINQLYRLYNTNASTVRYEYHLVSSDLHWLAHHTSLSTVWINRASQEPESEHIPVINQLYRLYNTNASTVRYEYHLVSSDLHWLAHHTSLSTVWINRASQEPESEHIPVINQLYRLYNTNASTVRYEYHLVSSDLHWLAHHTSLSTVWINRASQEPESEHIPVINQLYRLYNTNASTVRSVMVANNKVRDKSKDKRPTEYRHKLDPDVVNKYKDSLTIRYEPEFYARSRPQRDEGEGETSSADYSEQAEHQGSSERESTSEHCGDLAAEESSDSSDQDFTDRKLFIYTCGTATYVPHKVCFKYIENVHFPKHLKPGPPIQERIAARQREREREGEEGPDWTDYQSVKYMFDEPDRAIDVLGHIIGMALSPDHKFLYMNVQLWPFGCTFEHPMMPPPTSQALYMLVVDLESLDVVGAMTRPAGVYSKNGHFLFLDVSQHLVGSGAEERQAYLWDRHYGVVLARLEHSDVVNAVAFSPRHDRIFLTACDDYSIRIWRSRREVRRLGLQTRRHEVGVPLHRGRPCSVCD